MLLQGSIPAGASHLGWVSQREDGGFKLSSSYAESNKGADTLTADARDCAFHLD